MILDLTPLWFSLSISTAAPSTVAETALHGLVPTVTGICQAQPSQVAPFGHLTTSINSLTSLDWLHTVAMKVLGELNELNYSYEEASIRYLITRGCVKKPINGEYVDLFNAVYDGIVFLNDLKSKQNEH